MIRRIRGPAAVDALLVSLWVVLLLQPPDAPLRGFLLAAIPLVLSWGFLTLHFPNKVVFDDTKVVFSRYGRTHAFAWRDVERVSVRRFVVQDRVLVRLEPSPAWRGSYWLVDSVEGFEGVVRAMEARASTRSA